MTFSLYRQRTFAEKFNVAFEWLRYNWRPLLKFVTFLLLPMGMLQAIGGVSMVSTIFNPQSVNNAFDTSNTTTVSLVGLSYLAGFVGTFLSYSMYFALIKLTFLESKDLHEITFRELWKSMTSNMLRLFGGGIGLGVILVVAMLVMSTFVAMLSFIPVVGAVFLFLIIPACLAACTLFIPFYPIYLYEDIDFIDALSQSVHLGYKCWWGFISTGFVMLLLVQAVAGFGSVPFFVCIGVKAALASGDANVPTPLINFLTYLSQVLMTYVGYAISILSVLIVCIQYGHATDKLEGYSADSEVEEF